MSEWVGEGEWLKGVCVVVCGWVVVLILMCVGRQATPTTIKSGALRLAMTTETSSCSTCGALRGTACMGVVGCLGSRSGCTSTNTMRWETNVGNGVVGLEFDRKDIEMNKLVVSCLESKLHLYDMRTQVGCICEYHSVLCYS